MPDEDTPKRLTYSYILDRLLTRTTRPRPSVTMSYTTGGMTTWTVDVPAEDGETAEDAEKRARAIHDRLYAKYGRAQGHDAAEVSYTRNAKGDIQLTASGKTTEENPSILAMSEKVRKVFDANRMRYPMADGKTAREGSVA